MDEKCVLCKGTGKFPSINECSYCNGTGESNHAAEAFLNNHLCQCEAYDREICPICKKKCHHNTNFSPRQTIEGGQGGTGTQVSYKEPKTEEIIIQ